MADQNDVDLDSIIDRLLEVRGSRPGKQVQLLEAEIRHLCQKAREIFISQPILLELEAPIKVCTLLQPYGLQHFFRHSNPVLTRCFACCRSAAISMASIMTFSASLNTEDSRRKQTISSLGTTSIEVNSLLRPFACFSRTRSSIQRISSSCVGTMSVHRSTAYTDFTMNARGDIISSFGRRSPIVSTACRLQQSSTRKFSPCTGD